jgi:hypothetical protein
MVCRFWRPECSNGRQHRQARLWSRGASRRTSFVGPSPRGRAPVVQALDQNVQLIGERLAQETFVLAPYPFGECLQQSRLGDRCRAVQAHAPVTPNMKGIGLRLAGLARYSAAQEPMQLHQLHSRNIVSAEPGRRPYRRKDARQVLRGVLRRGAGQRPPGRTRVRITAQLVDAVSGAHLWVERYDRTQEDVFAVQEEISQSIVATVAQRIIQDSEVAAQQPVSNADYLQLSRLVIEHALRASTPAPTAARPLRTYPLLVGEDRSRPKIPLDFVRLQSIAGRVSRSS